jgi:hypothetical protein
MDGTHARAVLGVSAHASPDELRRAFRHRARCTHPDHGGDATQFHETMVAFRALLHPRSPAARAPEGVRVEHVPFDRYDSSPCAASRRTDRPSFADVLRQATATAA